MIRILFVLLLLLIPTLSNGAVLVQSATGQLVQKSSISAAVGAADTAGKTIIINSPQTLSGNVTIPSTINLKIEKGGVITTTGYTFAVDGPFDAGTYQVFAGAGTVSGLKEVQAEWFYDGSGDWTTAINAAIATARSNTLGGTVILPAGSLNVTSINASSATADFTKTLKIKGRGKLSTTLVGTSATAIVLDAIGTNDFELEDFTIAGVGTTGLLLARSTTSTNCSRSKIRNINIDGSFSIASHVAIAAESSVYEQCRFENSNVSAKHTTFYTGNYNDAGITSPNGTIYANSNTDNRMFGCEFYAPYDDAEVVVLQGTAGYAFYSPLVITGNANRGKLVVYRSHPGDHIFNGPVAWISPLFEGLNPTVHYLDGETGQGNYFKSITVRDGYSNIYDTSALTTTPAPGSAYKPFNMILGNTASGTQNYLSGCRIEGGKYNEPQPPLITVNAVIHSNIDIKSPAMTDTITVTGFQQASVLRASFVNEALMSIDYQGQTYVESYNAAVTYYPDRKVTLDGATVYICKATTTGNAPPNATYWVVDTSIKDQGHIRWNLNPYTSDPNYLGIIGWSHILKDDVYDIWQPFYADTYGATTYPIHADNAAALAAGMQAGRNYRTPTGQVMVVY